MIGLIECPPLLRLPFLAPREQPTEISGNQTDSPLTELSHISAHSGACFTLSWSQNNIGLPESQGGLGLLASGGADGRIIIWQLATTPKTASTGMSGMRITPIAAMRNAHGVADVNALNWCLREDGKGSGMLVSAGDDGSVKVWRVAA
jgi:WD40 repeat protein